MKKQKGIVITELPKIGIQVRRRRLSMSVFVVENEDGTMLKRGKR